MSQDCKSIVQNVTNLEKDRSELQQELKSSGSKAAIVAQINTINSEISRIKKANPNCFNIPEPPKPPTVVTRKTSFNPVTNGFSFPNAFINSNVYFAGTGPYETRGRCGGMAYASLDYYFAGRPYTSAKSNRISRRYSTTRRPSFGRLHLQAFNR